MTKEQFNNLKINQAFFHIDGWKGTVTSSKLFSTNSGNPFFKFIKEDKNIMALSDFYLEDYFLKRPTIFKKWRYRLIRYCQ